MEITLKDYIREVPDFPKPGILFKDISPLWQNHEALQYALEQMLDALNGQKIDKVVGIEARGFPFGAMLAEKLGAGFVPIRKPGKLPLPAFKEPYLLEYGLDTLEMHQDAITKGEKILLHDDILATGGTAGAACKLVEKAKGEIVQCSFILELEFLKGRNKLKNQVVNTLIKL